MVVVLFNICTVYLDNRLLNLFKFDKKKVVIKNINNIDIKNIDFMYINIFFLKKKINIAVINSPFKKFDLSPVIKIPIISMTNNNIWNKNNFLFKL
jgi:hypothetical protein